MNILLTSTSIYPLTVLQIDDFRYIYIGYKSMWLKVEVLRNIKLSRKLSYPSLVWSTGK